MGFVGKLLNLFSTSNFEIPSRTSCKHRHVKSRKHDTRKIKHILLKGHIQWRIQDFPSKGRHALEKGSNHIFLAEFLKINYFAPPMAFITAHNEVAAR